MPQKLRHTGSSLLETVIALFVLAAAMIVSFQLFHRATAWQGEIELRSSALVLALAKIDHLQTEAADFAKFSDGLSAEVGTSGASGHPEFQITVAVDDLSTGGREIFSPSQAFEKTFSGTPPSNPPPLLDPHAGAVVDDRKKLENSYLVATVTVSSVAGRMRPLTLTALLREPPRKVDKVVVSAPSALNVPYQQATSCTAQVLDVDGEEIKDVVITWRCRAVTSYGTVYQARDGSIGTLQYVDYNSAGNPFQPLPGQCRLTASARVEGVTVWADSDVINLGP